MMEPYSFWQDFFATFRSSPDAIKALLVIVPPTFVIGLVCLLFKARRRVSGGEITIDALQEAQPIRPDGNEQLLIFARGRLLHRFEVSGQDAERGSR